MSNEEKGLAKFVEGGVTLAGNIGVDEVVNVFVSRYEEQLFEKKNELSNEVRMAKQSLNDQERRLKESVDKSKYKLGENAMGLRLEVGEARIVWDRRSGYDTNKKKPNRSIDVDVTIVSAYTTDSIVDCIEISEEEVKMRDGTQKEVERLNQELQAVMEQIRDVGRKERQIRAKISAAKLEQEGYSELVNDPDLLKLVQL